MALASLVYRSSPPAAVLFAVPYLGLVYFARRRMRRMSEPELVKLSFRVSALFVGLACLCILPVLGGSVSNGGWSALNDRILGVFVALLGAAEYVLLADGVLCVCYLARLVRRETAVGFLRG